MNSCPHCGREVATNLRHCVHCGQALAVQPALQAINPPLDASSGLAASANIRHHHGDTTVRYEGPPLPPQGQSRRITPLDTLFAKKTVLLIGRSPDADVCLSHPLVSRHHALLERVPDGRLRLTDLESVNGISVNGQRMTIPVFLDSKAAVGIGPFLFTTSAGNLFTVDSSRSLRLEARNLEKTVIVKAGQKRKLLDDINVVIEPGEFVSLLGPSGSGKTTLMDCLNGRRWATGGKVLANGEDFYRYFDNFRQSLGYVPQRDIVHTQLTVYRALYYTARLRLPPDTSSNELNARIEEVIRNMELGPHRDTLVANLSGGQIKRVSLGAELLARPCLLYIDEATSGLDAGTESRMMRLFRQLADEGKSLICITHNVDNVDRCHLALILARGKVIYYGPPADAPKYFGVGRISDIYDRIGEREVTEWEKAFRASEFCQEFVAKRLASVEKLSSVDKAQGARHAKHKLTREGPVVAGDAASSAIADNSGENSGLVGSAVVGPVASRPKRPPLWHQFRVLTARYGELLWGDRRSMRLLWLQAPAVAVILLVGFINKPFQRALPVLRHLTSEEKHVLSVLKGIEQDLAGKQPSTEDRDLPQVTFVDEDLGQKRSITFADIRQWLSEWDDLPGDSVKRQFFEKRRIEITSEGSTQTVSLTQVRHMQQVVSQSQLGTKLLQTNLDMPVVPEKRMIDPRYTYMLLFMIVIIVLWFGCNNAAKEIVKEEAIYGRERAVNLGILPYLSSKFLLLSLVTIVQALLLMVILYGVLEGLHALNAEFQVPSGLYSLEYVGQFGVLTILSMTGVALGLLLSACVSSPDRANALLPYVLIPQIILGGGIMPVKDGILQAIAAILSPVYWAFRAIRTGTNTLPEYTGYRMDYTENAWFACGVLAIQLVALLGLTTLFLRQKDVRRG